ncbi:nitrate reductase (NADH) [[Emmonsia] crescens]|uniref:Nitrate reductase (NADH) n=1 Tax=[Emmonsia] crescens TaxID=73230 RepID=A0A0G2I6D4_9EURO|nr:nitrate reductase (NADH) [Emmonsia crescens UAMH 3008]
MSLLQPAKRLRLSHIPSPAPHYRRQASTNTNANTSPLKQRTWLRATVVTVVAAAIGAYVRYEKDSSSATLNPYTFTQYELVSKTPVSSTSSIFTLRPVKPGDNDTVYKEAWQRGLWSVQFKQPQLQIGRDYTPLPPISQVRVEKEEEEEEGGGGGGGGGGGEMGEGALQFLIRKDPYGEVSGYLHSLQPGAKLDIRGPRLDYILPADVEEILFIAGGTGIAPALQTAHTLFRNNKRPDLKTRMHILWANRRREDCLGAVSDNSTPATSGLPSWWKRVFSTGKDSPRKEHTPQNAIGRKSVTVRYLEELKAQYPDMLTVDYFVDEEGALIGKDSVLNFTKPEGENGTWKRRSSGGRKLILISGPDGFISYLAGPKMWSGGKEIQGPLQGLIRQLDLKDWSVWKL